MLVTVPVSFPLPSTSAAMPDSVTTIGLFSEWHWADALSEAVVALVWHRLGHVVIVVVVTEIDGPSINVLVVARGQAALPSA